MATPSNSISLREVLAVHALQFEPSAALATPAPGGRLLLAFVLTGLLLQPGLSSLARNLDTVDERWSGPLVVLALLAATLAVLRLLRLDLASLGLRHYATWSRRQRLYAWTIFPMVAVAFGVVFARHFVALAAEHGWAGVVAVSIPTGLLWGGVQELIYRGLLQRALAARFGGPAGVVLANLVFTFGPLHADSFRFGSAAGPNWALFAGIFAIGLLFGTLYQRSGNLWLAGVLHGLWPLNMT